MTSEEDHTDDLKSGLWKRYVDDVLEIVRKDQVDNLTTHLNQTDPTDSIKFTYEKEQDCCIPFLDTLIVRKPDGSVKLLIYRKATHTDQYLNFSSHHPIHHKLGVVRTLLDRSNTVITDPKDRELEEEKIKVALKRCGYPDWTFKQVKQKMDNKQDKKQSTKMENKEKAKGLVIIPYVCMWKTYLRKPPVCLRDMGSPLQSTLTRHFNKCLCIPRTKETLRPLLTVSMKFLVLIVIAPT